MKDQKVVTLSGRRSYHNGDFWPIYYYPAEEVEKALKAAGIKLVLAEEEEQKEREKQMDKLRSDLAALCSATEKKL